MPDCISVRCQGSFSAIGFSFRHTQLPPGPRLCPDCAQGTGTNFRQGYRGFGVMQGHGKSVCDDFMCAKTQGPPDPSSVCYAPNQLFHSQDARKDQDRTYFNSLKTMSAHSDPVNHEESERLLCEFRSCFSADSLADLCGDDLTVAKPVEPPSQGKRRRSISPGGQGARKRVSRVSSGRS